MLLPWRSDVKYFRGRSVPVHRRELHGEARDTCQVGQEFSTRCHTGWARHLSARPLGFLAIGVRCARRPDQPQRQDRLELHRRRSPLIRNLPRMVRLASGTVLEVLGGPIPNGILGLPGKLPRTSYDGPKS